VITLRLIEGRSVAETAAALRKTEGAVKVLQARALQSLRRTLGP
jgi:DNA-directed RNA polymerase specialized sigma24 family protein